MMRFVFPSDENELALSIREGDNFYLPEPKNGKTYVYIEEDDTQEYVLAIFKFFETGETAEGYYVGSITRNSVLLHLYWVNAYTIMQAKVDNNDSGRLDIRGQDDLPEVRTPGIDPSSADSEGR